MTTYRVWTASAQMFKVEAQSPRRALKEVRRQHPSIVITGINIINPKEEERP